MASDVPSAPALPRRGLARALVLVGALALGASAAGLVLGLPPFEAWAVAIAGWGWIVLCDGVVYLRTGSSLALSRTRSFLLLVPWSVAFWLFYEAANFVLLNWYYVDVPAGRVERLGGIALSFATILPALLETADLLAALGLLRRRPATPLHLSSRALRVVFLTGLGSLLLCVSFPRVAFGLLWVVVPLCLEPLLCRGERRGALRCLTRGDRATPPRYLVAGLLCGAGWQLLNHGAEARWIVTVPSLALPPLLAMPAARYLGFALLGLSGYTLARFLVATGLVPEFERDLPVDDAFSAPATSRQGAFELQLLGVSAAFFFSSLVLPGVERWTVRSTTPVVADLIRDEGRASVLVAVGLYGELGELLDELDNPQLAALLAMTDHEREETRREVELMRLAGMGRRGAAWLESVRVYDVAGLAAADEAELVRELAERGSGPGPRPYAGEVRVWMRQARAAATAIGAAAATE